MEEKRQAQLGGEVDGGMWKCLYTEEGRKHTGKDTSYIYDMYIIHMIRHCKLLEDCEEQSI